jgi:putative addiction module antidote
MHALKLTQIGNSVGVILPREMLAKLRMAKGDTIYAIDQPDGVRLTIADPDFAAQMEVACKVMKDRRAVLRELAK